MKKESLKYKKMFEELKSLFKEAESKPITVFAVSHEGALWNVRVWLAHPIEDIALPIATAVEDITDDAITMKRKVSEN